MSTGIWKLVTFRGTFAVVLAEPTLIVTLRLPRPVELLEEPEVDGSKIGSAPAIQS